MKFIHNYMTIKLGIMFQKFVIWDSKMNTRVETIYLSYLRRISFHIYVSVSLYLRNSTVLDAVIHRQSSPYSWLKYIFFKLLTVLQNDSFWLSHPSSKMALDLRESSVIPYAPGKLASSYWSTLMYKCPIPGHNARWL